MLYRSEGLVAAAPAGRPLKRTARSATCRGLPRRGSARRRGPIAPLALGVLGRVPTAGAGVPPFWDACRAALVNISAAAAAIMLLAAQPTALVAAPPAHAHGGGGTHAAAATPGTAAAQFTCAPVADTELASAFGDLNFHHRISTRSPGAQALFDLGLLQAFNFNQPEALRAFKAGLLEDPDAPMLHWGVAYASGPFLNKVWGPVPDPPVYPVVTPQEFDRAAAASQAALAALQAAQRVAATPEERAALERDAAYVTAQAALLSGVAGPADAAGWEAGMLRYARALEAAASVFPDDPDAPALAAEARMNRSPWVYWTPDFKPFQEEGVVGPSFADIDLALARDSTNPLASHLMVHLTEASGGNALRGEPAADLLAAHAHPLMGHLTHMPSHQYLVIGRWHDAVTANVRALAGDEAVASRCLEPYLPEHNAQLLLYAALMGGEEGVADAVASHAVDFPRVFGPQHMSDGSERSAPALVHARFARWDPILQLTPDDFDYSRDGVVTPIGTAEYSNGAYRYVRALALAAHAQRAARAGDAASEAELRDRLQSEVAALEAAVDATPEDYITKPGAGLGIYTPGFKTLGRIHLATVRARVAVLDGDWKAAAEQLQGADAQERSMGYTEPPRVRDPVVHCWGWVLLQQGRLEEAAQVYRQALLDHPNSPWALKGLQQVLERQGDAAGAQQVGGQLALVWATADPGVKLESSCPQFADA